jgi:post-segregation antitoxin (ccd killing protein)
MTTETAKEVELDKDTVELAKKHGIDITEAMASFLGDLKKKPLERMTEEERKEAMAKLSGGEMVTVQVDLFSPFVDFMKDYLAYFGSKKTLEDLCREMIYDDVKNLYNELEGWIEDTVSHVEKGALFNKYGFLGCVSVSDPEEEDSEKSTKDD